jgi:hypothetical protein
VADLSLVRGVPRFREVLDAVLAELEIEASFAAAEAGPEVQSWFDGAGQRRVCGSRRWGRRPVSAPPAPLLTWKGHRRHAGWKAVGGRAGSAKAPCGQAPGWTSLMRNTAPVGSASVAILPNGVSSAGCSSRPPRPSAVSMAASTFSTPK